ncbi:aldehyde reductase [Lecanosticta acicola]|uniref:Aldehyde reductase n=1 Tax=Lecanosticta acicola TaxID=111012 RepID=A0AAI8YX49_9PEZI|nr:aldehyde reductase [Lecanosticta acicola]
MAGQSTAYDTLSKGSTILITGINGMIASHCADQALRHGYKVRGTTRSLEKNSWMPELFDKKYGSGLFELVKVEDMQQPGAFNEAMQGCSAVMHTASIVTFDPDPDKVIPATVAGIQEVLKCAANTPSVKRVVYTSSQAAVRSSTETPLVVSQDTWNDQAIQMTSDRSQLTSIDEFMQGAVVYAASKTLAEKTCFEFVEREKPHFVLNTVCPNYNTGPSIHPTQPASSSGLLKLAFLGDPRPLGFLTMMGGLNYIDVRDDASLHLAAAIFDDVKNERIWGMAGEFNYNDIIDLFGKYDPKWQKVEKIEDVRDKTVYDVSRSIELLKRLGCDGWISLEDSIRANLADESSAISNIIS